MHRPTPTRLLTTASCAALAAALLAGCSGGSSGGGDAAVDEGTSVAQFCGGLTDFRADLAAADPADPTTYVQRLREATTRLVAVGLPEEMSAEARAGFRARTTAITSLPDSPTDDDLAAVDQPEPELDAYVDATCPEL